LAAAPRFHPFEDRVKVLSQIYANRRHLRHMCTVRAVERVRNRIKKANDVVDLKTIDEVIRLFEGRKEGLAVSNDTEETLLNGYHAGYGAATFMLKKCSWSLKSIEDYRSDAVK